MDSQRPVPEALRRVGLRHNDPEPEFERITRLAARLLAAPAAVFSLADEATVYVKSVFGGDTLRLGARELPLGETLTGFIVASRAPLVVPDASTHPLVTANAALRMRAASYAVVPVKNPEGVIVGVLGVADGVPRDWSGEDLMALTDLAAVVAREIELRVALSRRPDKQAEAERVAQAEASEDVLCVMDANLRIIDFGARAHEIWGYTAQELIGRSLEELLASSDAGSTRTRLGQLAERGGRADFRSHCLHKDGTLREIYWTATWSEEDRTFYAITRQNAVAMEPARTSDKRILVVDDYREIAILVRTALVASGFSNVEVASGPAKALDLASVHTFDLVVSDLRMQPMNGVDLFTKFRQMPGMESVPFLIISGYANRDVVDRMRMLGVDGFVAKPFRTDDLIRHVRRAFAEREAAESGRAARSGKR